MDAPKKMSKITIWIIVALIVIAIIVTLYFTVFKKNGALQRTTEEPGAQPSPCDAKAPIPQKGKAKNETGGYCIPSGVDLFALDPIADKKDIMGWMGYVVENNWKVDNMGHLATVAAYQLSEQRRKAK